MPPPVAGKFWVQPAAGQQLILMDAAAIQEWFRTELKNPAVVQICPENTANWKTAVEYGFKDGTPF
jgi:hypothetical protein